MKKIYPLIFSLVLSELASAQLPQEFSYQAVARNAAGVIIANQSIALRFKIHSGSPTGTVEYSETRTTSTNQFGLFTVAIGSAGATNVTGSIATINWSASVKYLQVEMDPAGGSSFTDMGTFKLLSVPYAMHSGSSASDKWNANGTHIYNNNGGNIGIGLTTPDFPLSFGPALGDKISLWSNSTNSYGFGIQTSLLQIHTDGSAADIAFGYGSSNLFTEKMRIQGNGNVGIGTTTATAPLTLGLSLGLGKKIILYPGNTGDAGFGVFTSELRIASDYSGAAITFGTDDRTSGFVERLRIQGNGNVGISSNNPSQPLTLGSSLGLGKKITLFPGSTGDAGFGVFPSELRIASDFSGADISFGYDDRTSGFTEKFRMKANGAFVVNGSTGTTGQVLKSNGSSGASWVSPTNSLYNSTVQVFGTDQVSVAVSAGTPVAIPGMTYTFSTAGNAKVIVMFNVNIYPGSCLACSYTICNVHLFLDGTDMTNWSQYVPNDQLIDFSANYLAQVGPGTHTIDLRATKGGPAASFGGGGNGNNMIIQIIPE